MREDAVLGRELAGYRIETLIGRGGMSRVYRAEQLSVRRSVALKLLSSELADNEDFRARFLAESHLAATIEHPNILPIYDAGEAEGYLFIAMRLVEGTDMRSLLERERRLSLERAVELLTQAASALDAAHERGLVHRDVKPANLLLAGKHVYLADFGVAKVAAARRELTRTGIFVGTLDYAAPEQIRNEALDGRTDLYALGCVLFHCLTGAPPFDRTSEYATMQAHLYDPPPSAERLRPELPRGIDTMIATALAKLPDERFRTGRHFVQELRSAAEGSRSSQAAGAAAPAYRPGSTVATTRAVESLRTSSARRAPIPRSLSGDRRRTSEFVLVAVGLALGVVALLIPRWASVWTPTTPPVHLGPSATWVIPVIVAYSLIVLGVSLGIRWRALAWAGLGFASASTLWGYGFYPLIRDSSFVPAPNYNLGWAYWLSILSLVIAAFGLSMSQRTWARLVSVGLAIEVLAAATPSWAVKFTFDRGITLVRAFDEPNGQWAALLAAGCTAMLLALAMRILTARTRTSALQSALRLVVAGFSWFGLLAAAFAAYWLGIDRLEVMAGQASNKLVTLGEGWALAAMGLAIAAAGLVVEITTAGPVGAGRWNTIARFVAPSVVKRINLDV